MTVPAIEGYTAQELESLTPDELEALQAGPGPGDEGDEDEDDDTPLEPSDVKPADKAAGTEQVDDETPPDKPPLYSAEAPADAAAVLAALKADKSAAKNEDKAALKQLHDGEIDFDQYEIIKTKTEDAIDAANDKIGELERAISKAEISAEMSQQEALRAWTGEVGSLMKQGKAEGLDYAGDAALNKELNGLVRAFGAEAIQNGMSDVGLAASKWALAQAHSVMRVRHAAKLVTQPQARPPPNAQRHTLTTLGGMPNAESALERQNELLKKIGKLDGEDIEKAMASLTKSEMETVMASAT